MCNKDGADNTDETASEAIGMLRSFPAIETGYFQIWKFATVIFKFGKLLRFGQVFTFDSI